MIDVQVLKDGGYEQLPQYETPQSAGADLRSTKNVVLKPHDRVLVPTGLKVAIPAGYEIQIRPRSGLALKKGITVLNTPGTIDGDYRGEIGVILFNTTDDLFYIEKGDRIAQAVLSKAEQINWIPVEELDETVRGEGGFGHTKIQ
jgi:dUTP pyrophosphatase